MPQRSCWNEAAFGEFLRTHPQVTRALDELAPRDQREKLISFLRAVINPNSKARWHHFVEEWVPSTKRAKQVAKMLEQASAELQKFACSPLGAILLVQNSETMPRALTAAMQRQAQSISRWAESPLAQLCGRFSFRKLWKHLPLALTVEFVKQHRAGRIPWGDLAYALEAIATGYGVERDISPDALRKQYTAFSRSETGKAFTSSGLKESLLSLLLSWPLS